MFLDGIARDGQGKTESVPSSIWFPDKSSIRISRDSPKVWEPAVRAVSAAFHQRASYCLQGPTSWGIHAAPLTEDMNRAQFHPLQCLCIQHPRKHVTIKLERGLSIWGRQSCVGSDFGDQSNLRGVWMPPAHAHKNGSLQLPAKDGMVLNRIGLRLPTALVRAQFSSRKHNLNWKTWL